MNMIFGNGWVKLYIWIIPLDSSNFCEPWKRGRIMSQRIFICKKSMFRISHLLSDITDEEPSLLVSTIESLDDWRRRWNGRNQGGRRWMTGRSKERIIHEWRLGCLSSREGWVGEKNRCILRQRKSRSNQSCFKESRFVMKWIGVYQLFLSFDVLSLTLFKIIGIIMSLGKPTSEPVRWRQTKPD